MFFIIGVLKNFALFTGKHLCWSLSISLAVPLSASVCLCVCVSVCLSVCLSVRLSASLCRCLLLHIYILQAQYILVYTFINSLFLVFRKSVTITLQRSTLDTMSDSTKCFCV